MAFEPVVIPFKSGIRTDLPTLHMDGPEPLRTATNVVMMKNGSLRRRPGSQSRDSTVQTLGHGNSLIADLATATSGLTAAGVVAVNSPGVFGAESPMLLYQGGQFIRRGTPWTKVGTASFLRKTVSDVIRSVESPGITVQPPAHCGNSVVSLRKVSQGQNNGLPFYNGLGQLAFVGTGTTANWATAADNGNTAVAVGAGSAIAQNNVYYMAAASDVRGTVQTSGTPTNPVTTDASIASDGATGTGVLQLIAAVASSSLYDYVAYVSSTAGRIVIKSITRSTGAVAQTLNVDGLWTTTAAVGLAYLSDSGTDRVCLVWVDEGAALIKTKVFTGTTGGSGALSDTGLNLTLAVAPLGLATANFGSFSVGTTAANNVSIIYRAASTANPDLIITGRSFTAATETSSFRLYGVPAATGKVRWWMPLFQSVVVAGRTLAGVQLMEYTSLAGSPPQDVSKTQWVVLDLTELYASGTTTLRRVVASGLAGSTLWSAAVQAGMDSAGRVHFCVPEGVEFSSTTITRGGYQRVTLEPVSPAVAGGAGGTYLTGQTAHLFDGRAVEYHPFPETYPLITARVIAAGGTLAAGSYTYQATWEAIDGLGRVLRSGASDVFTVTGVALNDKVTLTITLPQLITYTSDIQPSIRLSLWGTVVNPAADAALYLITTALVGGISGGIPAQATLDRVHSAPVDTTQPQLYTGGGIFDDEPPPAGDRGIAHAIDRVWVANQTKVFASKLLSLGYTPAWNTEGVHTIDIPSVLGTVQGLAGFEDRLVVVCSAGIGIVRGPGVDDSGNGAGWALDVIQGHGAGDLTVLANGRFYGPGLVTASPSGCAYIGRDLAVWLVDSAGTSQRISAPVMERTITGTPITLMYVPPYIRGATQEFSSSSNTPMFVFGHSGNAMELYFPEFDQWTTWSVASGGAVTGYCAINGTIWAQRDGVVSYDTDTTDFITGSTSTVTATITTGPLHPSGPLGWGRLRKVAVVGKNPGTSPKTITVSAIADDVQTIVTGSTSWALTVADSLWPRLTTPEFWADVQRCSFVTVTVSFTDILEVTGVVLWVARTGPAMPNTNRF